MISVARAPGIAPSLYDGSRAGVTFLNRDQLMVYAVEPTGHLSSRRGPEISSAFQLRLSLLDAKSEHVAATQQCRVSSFSPVRGRASCCSDRPSQAHRS